MTSDQLLTFVRDALATDATLAGWCVQRYGRGPTILLGIDDAAPPAEADYPVVVILGAERERGDSDREEIFRLAVGVGVLDHEVEEYQSGDAFVRTYYGAVHVEALRDHVEGALYRARILPVGTKAQSSSETFHPLYVSYVEFELRYLKSKRGAVTQ